MCRTATVFARYVRPPAGSATSEAEENMARHGQRQHGPRHESGTNELNSKQRNRVGLVLIYIVGVLVVLGIMLAIAAAVLGGP